MHFTRAQDNDYGKTVYLGNKKRRGKKSGGSHLRGTQNTRTVQLIARASDVSFLSSSTTCHKLKCQTLISPLLFEKFRAQLCRTSLVGLYSLAEPLDS
jgi:hypothetical protein